MNIIFHQISALVGSSTPHKVSDPSFIKDGSGIIQSVGFTVDDTNNTSLALHLVRGVNKALIAVSGTITKTAPSVSYPWVSVMPDDRFELEVLSGTSGDLASVDIRGEWNE